MRLVLFVLCILTLFAAGCGPTLQDTKVQYVIGVNSATSVLETLGTLKDANELSPGDVNTIKYVAGRFEFYRVQVRAAIDANAPAPVNAANGMKAALSEAALILIQKQGVK